MARQDKAHARQNNWWRRLCIGVLIAVSSLALGAFVVIHWTERQVLTTDNWVALVSPLPKQPVVSNALGNYIGQQVFAAVPVQAKISDALPPKAAFLAGPLTDQLQNLTTNTAKRVVASDGFQTIWTGANRAAMNRLVSTARGQTPALRSKINQKFDVDISGVSSQLSGALGKASTAIPALQPAAKKAVDVTTDLKARPRRIHQVIRTIDFLAVTLPLLIAASLLAALAISHQRRRTALAFAVTIFIVALVEIIAVKWGRQTVLNQVHNPGNIPAVGYIYDVLVGWLLHMIYVVLVAAVLLSGALLLAGPAKWAQSARAFVHLERLQKTRFMVWWSQTRVWVKHWEYYIWLAAAVLVLIVTAVLDSVTGRTVVNALLSALGLIALVHIIATPPVTAVTAKQQ